ncbi:hypothetical protein MHH85_04425 [Viridibacillus sp. FSL E2-0187]|uniref:hypothetical protein n=1 Tax=Viridibacillus TaxID=496496 RepID=UPI00187B1179|nr:hypothetical protein [Viridibacillus sp. JNUCC-6]QOV12691.1 hypothetical protein JNUCC6_08045 [Viridibacillus sp. JNUCC-6]
MKIFFSALGILFIAFILKIDLLEGTIPLAAFYKEPVVEETCVDVPDIKTITVRTIPGDNLQSLFALYPSESSMSFSERLELFYELNPHLLKQSFKPGESIQLPFSTKNAHSCTN